MESVNQGLILYIYYFFNTYFGMIPGSERLSIANLQPIGKITVKNGRIFSDSCFQTTPKKCLCQRYLHL